MRRCLTRAFILFYGERLTWFFTEEKPDGTEVSTACRTFENREEHPEGVGRYERLCRMQKSLDYRQDRPLKRMMREYDALSEMVASSSGRDERRNPHETDKGRRPSDCRESIIEKRFR